MSLPQSLYNASPLWLQNAAISLKGVAYRRQRLGGRFLQYVREFEERESWSADRLREYSVKELRRVLLLAFDEVPYYQDCWRRIGIERGDLVRFDLDDLPALPITSKQPLRDTPAAFLTNLGRRSSRLDPESTSGTTGLSVTVWFDTDSVRRFTAVREARSLRWAGTSMLKPRATFGGRRIVAGAASPPPYYRYNRAEKQLYFSAFHLSPDRLHSYLEGIRRYRPKLFTGYATSCHTLAKLMIEQGIRLDYQPDAAVLCAEKLPPEAKQDIRRALNTRAYEEYGAVENLAFAGECDAGRLHVSSDFGILELIGEDGAPVQPGSDGRVVCTGFSNQAQLLIRYELGDVAVYDPAPCPCGRTQFPVLREVVGRIEDTLIGPDGRELVRIHNFCNFPNVIEAQVVQERLDQLRVKLVAAPSFGHADEQQIRQRLAVERLGDVRIVFEKVDRIERTERGKLKTVICLLPPEQKHSARAAALARAPRPTSRS